MSPTIGHSGICRLSLRESSVTSALALRTFTDRCRATSEFGGIVVFRSQKKRCFRGVAVNFKPVLFIPFPLPERRARNRVVGPKGDEDHRPRLGPVWPKVFVGRPLGFGIEQFAKHCSEPRCESHFSGCCLIVAFAQRKATKPVLTRRGWPPIDRSPPSSASPSRPLAGNQPTRDTTCRAGRRRRCFALRLFR
jgi:hypothetical protein